MTRVALLGVGRWGTQLLRVLHARCEVAWCCNQRGLSVHASLAQRYPRIRSTVRPDDVFGDAAVDAVVIATPIGTHAVLVRQALEAGKHVFVEKPLATDPSDARALMELAAHHRRMLFVGHVFLYHPVLAKVKELTRDDPVSHAHMAWAKFGTFEEDLFWNLLSHPVSLALALFDGSPSQVTVHQRQGMLTSCDLVTAHLAFEPGRECWIEVNRCAPTKATRVTLTTTAGRVLAWEQDALYQLEPGQAPEPLPVGTEEPLAREIDAFLESVRSGRLIGQDPRHGAAVVEVIHELNGVAAR